MFQVNYLSYYTFNINHKKNSEFGVQLTFKFKYLYSIQVTAKFKHAIIYNSLLSLCICSGVSHCASNEILLKHYYKINNNQPVQIMLLLSTKHTLKPTKYKPY